mmetsp:Transcript_150691/g.482155  ORF Transcript_150691/g.482155 Transcript_150691/m.482155 type:complete len:195 (-) Transcript_150691:71-655(-)
MAGQTSSETDSGGGAIVVWTIFDCIGDGLEEKYIAKQVLEETSLIDLSGMHYRAQYLKQFDDLDSMREVVSLEWGLKVTWASLERPVRDSVVVPALWAAKARVAGITEQKLLREAFRDVLEEKFAPIHPGFRGSVLEQQLLLSVTKLVERKRKELQGQGIFVEAPWVSSKHERRKTGKKKNRRRNQRSGSTQLA